VTPAFDRQRDDLETRAIEAHRAYIAALVAWEQTARRQGRSCADGGDRGALDDSAGRCREAELHKEACRTAFRDLIDELGYVPLGHGIALPKESDSVRQADP
jgi:hypothetical protein